jgi:hypothetical protein
MMFLKGQSFNSCEFSKFEVLIWKDLAPRLIPKLESGEEPLVFGKLIARVLESRIPRPANQYIALLPRF